MQENPWIKRFERERASRKEAEKLLENKSLELYEANQSLEQKVKERTEELEAALNEANVAQKAKDAFLSTMSHELRTPLNAIIGFSQILEKQPDIPQKIKPFIEKINISGNNLLKLINTILNFSKIESDNMHLNKQSLHVRSFIHELIVLIEPQAEAKSIKVDTNIEENIITADMQLLTQALLNILSNAVKFTHNGGKISLVSKIKDNNFTLSIYDNGVGISKENQAKLFKPFIQIDNQYQSKINGTGLGLYLTFKIIELHKGKIEIKSELNKGTCFSISLPLQN